MTKVKTNFAFHKVDVGLDVHKHSWNAAVFLDGMYIRNIHQPPSPKALHTFLATTYHDATYRCAYECSKFDYWIHRLFTNLNIQCLVINPADIPSKTPLRVIRKLWRRCIPSFRWNYDYNSGRRNKALEEAFNSKLKIQKSKILDVILLHERRATIKNFLHFLFQKNCQAEFVEAGGE